MDKWLIFFDKILFKLIVFCILSFFSPDIFSISKVVFSLILLFISLKLFLSISFNFIGFSFFLSSCSNKNLPLELLFKVNCFFIL